MDKNEVTLSNKPLYRRVSLRTELVDDVEKFVLSNPLYRSIPDFIAEAIRLRFEELDHQPVMILQKQEVLASG